MSQNRQQGQGGERERFNLEDYVDVAERLRTFHKKHPTGRVVTEIVEHDREKGEIVFRAYIYRTETDEKPAATGTAREDKANGYINRKSYVENCETSAVGRALAMLGLSIDRHIASREEIEAAASASDEARGAVARSAEGQPTAQPPGASQLKAVPPPAQTDEKPRNTVEEAQKIERAPEPAKSAEEAAAKVKQNMGLIRKICTDLNALGDQFSIDGVDYNKGWTPPSLKAFINKRYSVEDGVEALTVDASFDLYRHLAQRLESLKKSKTAKTQAKSTK